MIPEDLRAKVREIAQEAICLGLELMEDEPITEPVRARVLSLAFTIIDQKLHPAIVPTQGELTQRASATLERVVLGSGRAELEVEIDRHPDRTAGALLKRALQAVESQLS